MTSPVIYLETADGKRPKLYRGVKLSPDFNLVFKDGPDAVDISGWDTIKAIIKKELEDPDAAALNSAPITLTPTGDTGTVTVDMTDATLLKTAQGAYFIVYTEEEIAPNTYKRVRLQRKVDIIDPGVAQNPEA